MSSSVQLMVVAPCQHDTIGPLKDALDRFAPSCVLIAPPAWQPGAMRGKDDETTELEALDQGACRALIALIQSHETAALIANDAAVAVATEADGCHLETSPDLEDRFANSRKLLGQSATIGVMPGPTRHMAMTLAEAGAEYVGYPVVGLGDTAGLNSITWWAEIFECPVVAFIDGDIAIARRLLEVGPPDFLGCPLLVDGTSDHLRDLTQLIDEIGQLPIAAKDAK